MATNASVWTHAKSKLLSASQSMGTQPSRKPPGLFSSAYKIHFIHSLQSLIFKGNNEAGAIFTEGHIKVALSTHLVGVRTKEHLQQGRQRAPLTQPSVRVPSHKTGHYGSKKLPSLTPVNPLPGNCWAHRQICSESNPRSRSGFHTEVHTSQKPRASRDAQASMDPWCREILSTPQQLMETSSVCKEASGSH